ALPAQGALLARQSRLLLMAPPAWFMGAQRVLLGHDEPYFTQLAQIAAAGFLLVSMVAVASYAVLYRHFDRGMLHTFGVSVRGRSGSRAGGRPARAAVRDFTSATFQRSALHQGVVIGLATCGVA